MSTLTISGLTKCFEKHSESAVNNVTLHVSNGEMIGLLGESGSGKTTLLRLIAGFEMPTCGEIRVDDNIVVNSRIFVAPEKRGVSMVFQGNALFPHLTVFKNITFGLDSFSAADKKERVHYLLDLLRLNPYENRYPHELSGGQRGRVSLARALAPRPALLLLDEPFSNLDDMLKHQIREDINRVIRETRTTAILVTHDCEDALSISDRVAIIRNGILQQVDRPEVLYAQPASCYVARFFGKTNILRGVAYNGGFNTPIGYISTLDHQSADKSIFVSIRPEHVMVVDDTTNGVEGTVRTIRFCGHYKEILLSITDAQGEDFEITASLDINHPVNLNDTLVIRPRQDKVQLLKN